MKTISVIIPLHEYNDTVKPMLENAIMSVPTEVNLVIAGPEAAVKGALSLTLTRPVSTLNVDSTNVATIVNTAVDSLSSEYFSILEFDDNYTSIWLKSFNDYLELEDGASIYLPLTEIYDFASPERGAVGYRNEAAWASAFSEKLGYLDIDSLLNYPGFNVSGAIINREDFVKVGKIKESMKVSFWYEFLLRLIHNGKKGYVIPKVGYNHTENRPGSMSLQILEMPEAEIDWWFELAKDEYLYKKDRKKTYEVENNA